jgi:Photosynthetic reaction centre cytochrome C subunit
MNGSHTVALLLGCSLLGTAVGAVSQGPGNSGAGANATVSRAGHQKPTNLKVLPKDISGDEIDRLMHRFQQDLGVSCSYCHEVNTQTQQLDYASDEKPAKEIARLMIKMNDDINSKYLAQVGDRRYAEPITCGNCHLGQVHPPAFEPKQQH